MNDASRKPKSITPVQYTYCCQGHSKTPNIVREKVQILQVSMNVTKNVTWRLQIHHARFSLQQLSSAGGQLHNVLAKLVAVQIVNVGIRTIKHVQNPLDDVVIDKLVVGRRQGGHDLLRTDTGLAAHALPAVANDAALGLVVLDLLNVHGVGGHLGPAFAVGAAFGGLLLFGRFQLIGEALDLGLEAGNLLVAGGELLLLWIVHGVGVLLLLRGGLVRLITVWIMTIIFGGCGWFFGFAILK